MMDLTEHPAGPATVDVVKGGATVIRLIGYDLTGLNMVPWNVFNFLSAQPHGSRRV